MPRFAANLSTMFNEWSFLDRFTAAADTGFSAVECQFPYEFNPDDIAASTARNDLTFVLFNLPPGNWANGDRGLAALPERKEDFHKSVTRALHYAKATNVQCLHVMAGLADAGNEHANRAYRENIRFAAEAAATHGIDILLEPLNDRDMPGYFLNSFALAVGIITDLRLPNVRLQYDIYHRQLLHGDVTKSLESLMDIIGHIQIASVPERHEPTTGELNDLQLLETLDALNYKGYVGCEYWPRANTLAGLAWMNSLK